MIKIASLLLLILIAECEDIYLTLKLYRDDSCSREIRLNTLQGFSTERIYLGNHDGFKLQCKDDGVTLLWTLETPPPNSFEIENNANKCVPLNMKHVAQKYMNANVPGFPGMDDLLLQLEDPMLRQTFPHADMLLQIINIRGYKSSWYGACTSKSKKYESNRDQDSSEWFSCIVVFTLVGTVMIVVVCYFCCRKPTKETEIMTFHNQKPHVQLTTGINPIELGTDQPQSVQNGSLYVQPQSVTSGKSYVETTQPNTSGNLHVETTQPVQVEIYKSYTTTTQTYEQNNGSVSV